MPDPVAAPPPTAAAPAAPAPAPSAPSAGTGFRASQMGKAPEPAAATPEAPAQADRTTGFVPDLDAPADEPVVELEAANDNGELDDGGEPDPWSEKLYDKLTAKELIEKLKADNLLPADLLDVLEHEFGEGDDKQRVSLREALDQSSKERMQLRDYSRRRHELWQQEQDFQARAASLQEAITGLNNPQSLFDDLQGLQVSEETLDAAVEQYVRQKLEYRKASPEMRRMMDEQRRLRQEHARTQAELRELKTRGKADQDKAYQQQVKSVLTTHQPAAFKKYGLNPQSAVNLDKFRTHALQLAGGKPITRDIIYQAAEATKQDQVWLERQERAQQAQSGRQPRGTPLSPSRAAAPAALQVQKQAPRANGFRASQFSGLRAK